MADGKWVQLDGGQYPDVYCLQCGEGLNETGYQAYQTERGEYCSEACADEAETGDHH